MTILPVLHNLRSTANVGAILRTCEGFGVQKVLVSGYTPRFNDRRLLPHLRAKTDRALAKTALGAENWLKIETVADLPAKITELKTAGWTLAGLENNVDDPRLTSLAAFTARPEKLVLVLGEEVHGIPPAILKQLDLLLEIPMRGRKESFNVSVAAGIALYALTTQ